MSDAGAFPRDERTLPRGAFAFSLACGSASLAISAALVTSADSLRHAVELLAVFVVLSCLEGVAYVDAVRPWLGGRPVPARAKLIQGALLLLTLSMFAGGPQLGGAALCGFVAGVFVPNASTMRYARVSRALLDEGEPGPSAERPQDEPAGAPRPPDRPARARPAPRVGLVLRATVTEERDRWLAWAAATLVVTLGCVALGTSGSVKLGIDFLGVLALAWVTRRLLGARLALRDFEEALTEPRRAYVVLLRDPRASGRPLLGVWAKEPVLLEGRLPRAQAVYRCDDVRGALCSTRGGLVVHQAWVDTGARPGSRPRWVAADAGVALPRRRSAAGPWYLASIIGAERPARARRLTIAAPTTTTEAETGTVATVISEPTQETGRWVRLFAVRLAGLALAALVLALV